MVYDYTPQTYRYTGGSVINTKEQQGCLLHFRRKIDDAHYKQNYGCNPQTPESLTIFVDKRSLAHIDWLFHAGRKWWKRFRLPKMKEQKASSTKQVLTMRRKRPWV